MSLTVAHLFISIRSCAKPSPQMPRPYMLQHNFDRGTEAARCIQQRKILTEILVVYSRSLTIWRKMLWRCSRMGEHDARITMKEDRLGGQKEHAPSLPESTHPRNFAPPS